MAKVLGRANQVGDWLQLTLAGRKNVRVFLQNWMSRVELLCPSSFRRGYDGWRWRKPGSRRAFVATRISLRRVVSISRVTSSCPALRCVHR
jgi:hypothetical protein